MQAVQNALFGKQPTPQEMLRKWQREIRHQEREMDRNIRDIEREEAKVKRSIKDASKRGDSSSAKSLAKEIVMARKTKTRIHTSKAHLHSVSNQLQTMMATVRVAGHLQKSANMMATMSRVMNYPAIAGSMRMMQQEMVKAGIMEEMIDESFDNMDDGELSDAAEEEVEKVFTELTAGVMTKAGAVPSASLPSEQEQEGPSTSVEEDLMRDRLTQLKS